MSHDQSNPQGQPPQNQTMSQPPPQGQPDSQQPKTKPPGQSMIKVCGILFTIFGVGSLGNLMQSISSDDFAILPSNWQTYLYASLAICVVVIASGIIGIALSGKKEKATLIVAVGFALIALRVIDAIWAFVVISDVRHFLEADPTPTIVGAAVLGCVLPILYVIGGNARKKAPF